MTKPNKALLASTAVSAPSNDEGTPTKAKLTKAERALVAETRIGFKELRNRDIALSDELIAAAIDRAGEVYDELDEDGIVKFWENAEGAVKAVSTVDPGISNLAHRLDDDETAQLHLMENIEHVMAGKMNRVVVYADFKRIYTKAELDAMPYPGTDKDSPYLGNFKPDIVKTVTMQGDEITTVWSNDFVSAMRTGKALETTIANCKKEIDNAGSIPAFKGWGKADLKAELADATARRNALRSMVKGAVELHHMFIGVSEMEKVSVEWIPTRNPSKLIEMPKGFANPKAGTINVTRSPKNLWIMPEGESMNGREFSVTQLLAFDVNTAIANGGTMADLVATGKKGKGEGGEEGGEGTDMTEMEAYTSVSRFINYTNKRENMSNILRILADKKHPEHNDWVLLIGDNWSATYPLAKRIRREYETLKETKMEGLDPAVPEKSEAAA